MSGATAELMNKGMDCLFNALGAVEAEKFISVIMREKFDYTKWQREHFDKMSPEELNDAVKQYVEENPHEGNAKVIL